MDNGLIKLPRSLHGKDAFYKPYHFSDGTIFPYNCDFGKFLFQVYKNTDHCNNTTMKWTRGEQPFSLLLAPVGEKPQRFVIDIPTT